MPLVYDPSALRYESTQQAYGQTWTLQRIEDDGAQLWRNGQGQEALVPRMEVEVRGEWVFDGKEDTVQFPFVHDGPVSVAPSGHTWTETLKINTTGDCTVEIDNKSTIEITGFSYQQPIKMHETVVDKRFASNTAKIGEIRMSLNGKRSYQWNGHNWQGPVSGRTNSTEPNQSNGPKAGDQRVSANGKWLLTFNGKTWLSSPNV